MSQRGIERDRVDNPDRTSSDLKLSLREHLLCLPSYILGILLLLASPDFGAWSILLWVIWVAVVMLCAVQMTRKDPSPAWIRFVFFFLPLVVVFLLASGF